MRSLAAACVVCVTASGVAFAQPPGETPPPPALEPPALLEFVEAPYPPEAEAAGLEAGVVLEILIAADGTVAEASVVEPAGHGFDEAALEAVRQFQFSPAKRDGVPVPARIRYRYVFELREETPPPEEPPPDEVAEEPAEPEPTETVPAEEPPREPATMVDEQGFGVVARVERPPREVTRRTITREELTRVPGTRGDALRVVELLPGVGRPAFGGGNLIVRGSAPQDSQVFFEGGTVPLLYHFGGLTSFINSRLLERIDFYPGNFSTRYGRKVGGVLDVGARDPATDGLHGVADISLIDASILAEGPITDDLSIAVGARRSYIDFIFENVVPEDAFDVVAAPVYYDYQLIASWRPTPRDRVRGLVYGSNDSLALVFAEPPGDDPAIQGDLAISTGFHHLHLAWEHELGPNVDQELSIKVGPTILDLTFGEIFQLEIVSWSIDARAEWEVRLAPKVRLIAGLDIQSGPFDITFVGPQPQQTEGNPMGEEGSISDQPQRDVTVSGYTYRPAVYVETSVQPVDPLQIVLGLRLDWYREIEAWSYDPRGVALLSIDEDTRIKAGVGIFSQPPEFQESSEEIGNPNLRPMHALHVGAGVERTLADGITAGVEGFYKYLWDRVVGSERGQAPFFVNDGVGRIYGLEVSGRIQPRRERPYFGFLSYTLSRSERRDREGEPWRLFDFDQTHILNLAFVYQLGRGWETGATFRLVSGNPYTPITGRRWVQDTTAAYRPIYGEVNSARNAAFHRLDVRLEKVWDFRSWKLAFYVDIQNVYNSTNPEGIIYDYRFEESAEIPGLPFLPSLGVRGEL